MFVVRFALGLALCCVAASATLADRFQGRDYELTDGRKDARPAPLVILLHGGGGTGPRQRRHTRFDPLARDAGVVAAYPSAPGRRWNDGRWGPLGEEEIAARDDVGWIEALIAKLAGDGLIDPARVQVIGHSNGGGMAMRIACERPELLSGIAVVSTKVLTDAPCPSETPAPAIFFYGDEDRMAPHAGRPTGRESPLGRDIGRALSAADSIALWARRNRCAPTPSVRRENPDPTDGVTHRIHDYAACAAPLRYVEMVGGGHAWPGAEAIRWPRLRRLIGDPIRDIDAGAAALAFWLGR